MKPVQRPTLAACVLALLLAFDPAGRLCAAAGAAGDEKASAGRKALVKGRQLYIQGKYAASAESYRKLLSDDAMRVSAAVGLSESLAMVGKYDQALKSLQAVIGKAEDRADWQVAIAERLEVLGRYEDALKHAVKANKLKPLWAPTILVRGRLLETLGRDVDATAVYQTMDRIVAGENYQSDARSLVALGMILDRYATLKGLKASEQANNIFNNYLQVAYQDVDPKYWPAHVAAGVFALSKHRPRLANREFAAAAAVNKRIPDVLVGRAALALMGWRFEQCLSLVTRALEINPHHADALLIKALCLLQWRKVDQAPPVLEKILQTNPNHLEALSLCAAVCIRQGQDEKAKSYIKRVEAINPNCWLLPNVIAEWLSAVRQFDRAETYYKKAIKMAPRAAGPLTNLGLLYMQTGAEDKAREVLEKAHEIDDFRADVVNYLNLLKELKDYQVTETDHFVIKVDGDHDAVMLRLIAEEAERIYKEVCGDFDHEPPEKTIIEVFPTHPKFSVRLSGRGWIGTIGACTGRVIVLVAPNDQRSIFGTYNWAAVLRHEFTHVVTLSATNNRIPHWFTEACAVWQQPDRRNYQAVTELIRATRAGRLYPVRQLDWGFIRPKRRGDRGLAYAQAEWTLEYIIATKGFDAVLEMLAGFRDGWTQAEVFEKVLAATEAEFDKAFKVWAKEQVRSWGFKPDPPVKLELASRTAKNNPDDGGAQADYAEALLRAGRLDKSEKVARAALKLQADNATALGVLARVLVLKGNHDEALPLAQSLELAEASSPLAARLMAECYMAKRSWSLAIAALERLKQRRPLDPYSYGELYKLYVQLGQTKKALPNLIELHRHSLTEQDYARQIADIYRAAGSTDEALVYYNQVTQINPYEASAYEAIAAIHRNARRYDQAVAAALSLTLLQPDSPDAWAKLSMVRFVAARAADDPAAMRQARKEAAKSVELDADGPGGPVLQRIDAALPAPAEKEDEGP